MMMMTTIIIMSITQIELLASSDADFLTFPKIRFKCVVCF